MHASKLPYQNTGLTVKKRLCCGQSEKSSTVLPARRSKPTAIFSRKRTNSRSRKSSRRNLRLRNVEAAEDFYIEAQEELDRKPYPTLEGFKIVIKYVAEQNPKAAAIKAEEIVDSSWLKKLDSEGFFEKVYGGK